MKHARNVLFAAAILAIAAPFVTARTGKPAGQGDYAIYVAPSTMVTDAPCPWVTIHTDVPYSAVDDVFVEVDSQSVPVASTYADACGRFVAKLRFDDVIVCCAPPSATVSMTLVITGDTATASTTVAVR